MIRLLSLTAVLLLLPGFCSAQTFRFRAGLSSVKQSGYHRILLPPSVVGQLNADRTDIRLYDNTNREIPYLLTTAHPDAKARFQEYEVVRRTIKPRVSTTLVLRNPAKTPINSLELVIKNTNLRKQARLSGSNDARTWYGIEDDYWLEPAAGAATTSVRQVLDFPLSDYEYYQLEISDSLSAPLNILKAGFYNRTVGPGHFQEIPGIKVARRDSTDRRTYVRITFPTVSRPDKLTFTIKGPRYYRRNAELAQLRTGKNRRKRPTRFFETIKALEISSSDSLHTVPLSGLQTDHLYLIIDNQDNPPLLLGSLTAQQIRTYLLADLQKDQTYHLAFANPNVSAPSYDLAFFRSNLPANPPVLGVSPPESLQTAPALPTVFGHSWLIWAALTAVIALLGYLSYRMVGEMKSQ